MHVKVAFTMAAFVAAAVPPSAAEGRPFFRQQVPNGNEFNCLTCHENESGGAPWNAFGDQLRANLVGGAPDWSAVFNLDADGDGQTNGEELGDPCGTWRVGQVPPRMTDISAPGDSNSTSADPNTPSCDSDAGFVDVGQSDTGVEADAGFAEPDAGFAETDAGFAEPDAAASPVDSGSTMPPDDDDGEEDEDDGCGCTTSGNENRAGPAWLMVAALGLVWRIRRRR